MQEDGNLGFTFRRRKRGEVEVLHHGNAAASAPGNFI